jgi:nucleoside-diphosphate-sugar epimerase
MRILVIGGTRFFGKRLVERLLSDGHAVTLLNRGLTPDPFGTRVERIQMDRSALHPDHPALSKKTWDIIYDQVCYDANEAKAACEAFQGQTSRYIFTSTQSVYQPGSALTEQAYKPIDHDVTKVVSQDENYGEAKRQAEAIFFQSKTFPLTAVRFPIVIGEDDYTQRLKFHVEHIMKGIPFYVPNVNARMSFISSLDAAAFLHFLLENSHEGPVNACSLEPISVGRVIQIIETIVGKNAILSEKKDVDPSPYGANEDRYMSAELMSSMGFQTKPIENWLPESVRAWERAIAHSQEESISVFRGR